MDVKDISVLYEYNDWANARALDAAGRLTAEEFTRELGGSYASARDTFVHMLWAEWVWLRRWLGESPRVTFAGAEFPDLPALRERWDEVGRERARFVASLADADLQRTISYVNTRGERWSYRLGEMMLHAANHSTYHRGQIATLLRQLGRDAATTDFLVYVDELAPPPPA